MRCCSTQALAEAPLSGLEDHRLASLWNRVGGFVRDHGERFCNFGGLRSFKEKFDPVWPPKFLACPRGGWQPRRCLTK
ncbi:MAG: phosphatidylglycerol lysyltransferase domain-containing protein [Tabrizicola sp.]|uniref:phosphatidylglycerol lysyltransferase domain-containing protein n=1 Tax=Tabrizicola sp. TaxID=2005166 RepID=UPI002ABBED58|nr:phosphatidylglycerol lysyltransferase domain-containing protein [Tabrizicola sp.]MDZ4085354.1 phosphatidylglycerol lysyltransferase domain-containing protein [Tabrizicola sp.]